MGLARVTLGAARSETENRCSQHEMDGPAISAQSTDGLMLPTTHAPVEAS